MSTELAQPPIYQPAQNGWGFEPDITKQRVVRRFTGAFSGVWPDDVHRVKIRGSAGGASGAKTASTTTGAGGGGAGQSCLGEIDVTAGDAFSGTVGTGGADTFYPGIASGNTNGNAGSNSTFVNGNRTPITLLGGNPGLASGAAGGVAGPATYVSLTGLTIVQGAAGGAGQVSDVGLPGGDTDVVKGGLGGNTSGGGGGGASLTGRGGTGGNNGVAGTGAPTANSGAGGGGGGADASTAGRFGGGAGSDGYWEVEYWTEQEDA